MKKILTILAFVLLVPLAVWAANTHSTDLERDSGQYWSLADGAGQGLDELGNFSMSFWVNVETAPSSGQHFGLAGKDDGSTQRAFVFYYRNDGGTLKILTHVFAGASANRVTNNYSVDLGTATWKHIVITFDGAQSAAADKILLYVDKTLTSALDANNFGTPPGTSGASSADFAIGTGPEDPTNTEWDGLRDEVLFYNSTLTQTDVNALFDDPCNPSTTNLVSRWAFDNDGTDSQGSNDLTNNNSATFSTTKAFTCAAGAGFNINQWIDF